MHMQWNSVRFCIIQLNQASNTANYLLSCFDSLFLIMVGIEMREFNCLQWILERLLLSGPWWVNFEL